MYIISGYMPRELPTTCLSVEPRFDPAVLAKHNMSAALPRGHGIHAKQTASGASVAGGANRRPLTQVNQMDGRGDFIEAQSAPVVPTVMENSFKYMTMIRDQLARLLGKPNLMRPDVSYLGVCSAFT
jgi:hypothetical protein